MDEELEVPPTPATDKLQTLLEIARGGESSILPELRQALDEQPEIWRENSNLASLVEHAWIQLIAEKDLVVHESIVREAAAMRARLAGSSPTPMEKLLVDRIVATWLQLQHADAAASAEGVSVRLAEFGLKRQAQAHTHYMTALGALATYRRLMPAGDRPTEVETTQRSEADGQPLRLVLASGDGSRRDPVREPAVTHREGTGA
jgi:hypothetical protein